MHPQTSYTPNNVLPLFPGDRQALVASKHVGCYACGSLYQASAILDYVNCDTTALCPLCGIDAVIPLAAITPANRQAYLDHLYEHFFA